MSFFCTTFAPFSGMMGLLFFILLTTLWSDSVMLDAYRQENMTVWQQYLDRPAQDRTQTDLLIEYGYCGYIVAEAKKEGKEALLTEAKRRVQHFKSEITNHKSQLPVGHYEMYLSAVYVYELRLHESIHPVKAMNLAKEATKLAPNDPVVLAYYATCMFFAPKPFGSKEEALKWFIKAEKLFRAPQYRNNWMREATLDYIQQCNEKLGKTPVASHASQRLLIPNGITPAKGWPAVVLFHDHGARFEKGWQKVIGDKPEPYYSGMAIGDSLAAHGYVVYCIDAPYWGTRRSALTQRQYSDSLGGAGSWYARVLAEDKASVQYVRSLPFVNAQRVAVAGFSYGAYRAWNIAAEDKQVACCMAAHWMTTLAQNRYNDSWLSMCRKDQQPFARIAASIAPRPFLLQYGMQDKLFPVNAVDSCVSYIKQAYSGQNTFRAEAYNCAHTFTPAHLQSWLKWMNIYMNKK